MTWKTTATLLLLVPVLQAPLARYAWIYRSILESVALMLKNNYDNMRNEMNHFAKHVIITGGGSNSDLFMQIFADMFNLPARRNAINGCASLGAAINKAVGLGLYPDYATAVDKMILPT